MVQGGPSFPLPGCVGPSRQLLRPPSSLTVAGTLPGQPAGWNYNDARKAKICTFAAAGAGVGPTRVSKHSSTWTLSRRIPKARESGVRNKLTNLCTIVSHFLGLGAVGFPPVQR